MSISLAKGGNVSLTKIAPSLSKVAVGLGWDVRTTTGADFDLDVLVRTVEYKRTLGVEAPEMAVLSALRSEYPALFGHPDLRERLRLYALTSCLREITGWPLQGPQSQSPEHPIRQLRRVVTEPAAFERLLAGILG